MARTLVDTSIDDSVVSVDSQGNTAGSEKQSIRYQKARYNNAKRERGGLTRTEATWEKEAIAAPFKELILPNLSGQFRIWKSQLRRRADMADRVIQIGNLMGAQENAIRPMFRNKTSFNGNAGLVFAIVKMYSRTHPDFTMLAGTNELAAIFAPDVYMCSEKATEYLAENWFDLENGCFRVANVIDDKLLTHRGLTFLQWKEIGEPDNAVDAAARLNELYRGTTEFADSYLTAGVPNFGADPMWADVYMETYPSWLTSGQDMPFDQIHGGAGVHMQAGRMFLNDKRSFFQFVNKEGIKVRRWGSEVSINGGTFYSVHTTETEQDTTLRKLERTSLLEFESEQMGNR